METLEARCLLAATAFSPDGDPVGSSFAENFSAHPSALTTYRPQGVSLEDIAAQVPRAPARFGLNPTSLIAVSETEPNNRLGTATPIPEEFSTLDDPAVDVTGALDPGESDFYRLTLQAGDILGANLTGAANAMSLLDSRGFELVGTFFDTLFGLPPISPLPGGGNASLSYVIDTPGTYFFEVSAVTFEDPDGDTGNGDTGGDGTDDDTGEENMYELGLRLFRPGLESEPIATRQTLFVDFDGATLNTSIFGAVGTATLSPLADFLPNWGLAGPGQPHHESDLNKVIDAVLDVVEENISSDIRERGNNGDFAATGIPGAFDIEILNSRDHADPFGQPNVSRVVVGGTIRELGIGTIGIAQSIDVGNFDTQESAVVLLDLLSASDDNPNSLNQYPLDPSATIFDLIGEGVGNITVHEAGHFFGAWHTFNGDSTPNIMDSPGDLANTIGIGPDGIFGSDDDTDVDFTEGAYTPFEFFTGSEETLQVISFGLATGKAPAPIIRGTVFNDEDGDGSQDGDDDGIGGRRVFLDLNGNGTPDSGEPSTTSSSSGNYVLVPDVTPGTYSVAHVLPADQELTTPLGEGTHTVTISSSLDTFNNLDFGTREIRPGSVSGIKWNDADGDAEYEPNAGESGLGGVYIYADINDDGIPGIDEPGTLTAADGKYTLAGLPPGRDYIIREVVPSGFEQTFPETGQPVLSPSGAATTDQNFWIVPLPFGRSVTGINFGNRDRTNSPPTVEPLPDQSVLENEAFQFDAGSFFSDVDVATGDALTFSAALVGGGALPGWLSINSTTGQMNGTPTSNDVGTLNITVIATDLAQAAASDTFALSVIAATNNAPFIEPGQQFDVIRDSDVGTDVGTVQASDPDAGDVISFSIVSGNPDGVFAIDAASGQITVARDGFLPAGSGPFVLGVEVTDLALATDTEDVTINVVVPEPLVAFQLDTFTMDGSPIPDGGTVAVGERFELRGTVEDARGFFATGVFAAYLDILYDDAIVHVVVGETQTLEILGNPTGGTYTLSFEGQTTTPIPLGIDASNVQTALEALSTIGTGNVRVRRVPPTDEAPNPLVFEITFQKNLADTDVDDITADGSALTGGTSPVAQVTNSFPADASNAGSFRRAFVFSNTYPNGLSAENLPDELSEVGAFDGETPLGGGPFDLFSVVLEGAQQGLVSFEGNAADQLPEHDVLLFGSGERVPVANILFDKTDVNVVEIVNNPPTATDDTYTTDEDTSVSGNVITDNTGNGADSDPDPSDTLTVTEVNGVASVGTSIQLASDATLFVNSDGSFQYDPTTSAVLNALRSDQEATDTFSYTIEDLAGEPSTADVSITIDGVNDRPTVDAATFTVEEDSGAGAFVGTVAATDPDTGDVLSFEIIDGNTNDTFAIGTDSGLITVANPALLTEGTTFSLTVEVTDSGVPALSDTAVITINVVAAAQPLVRFRLDVTDLDGNPLPTVEGQPQVNVGDDFMVHGFVEDTRGFSATGVFSAYLDVFYDNAASVSLIVGETWTLTLSPNVTGGTYTVTFEGSETTGPISLGTNLSQATDNLQQALEGLNSIGQDNVRVISTPLRDPDDPEIILNPFIFEIQFTGDLAGQDITTMSVDGSALTTSGGPATATIEETFPADPANPGAFRSAFLFEDPYVNGRSAADEPAETGRPASERVLGEVGAFDGQTPLGGGEFRLFSVAFSAVADGQLVLQGNPADVAGNDVLVFGRDDPVALNDIDYGDPVTVVLATPALPAFSNPTNALDVNADGMVSALDALHVINELNRNGTRALSGAAEPAAARAASAESRAVPSGYVDVNADGSITPLDALIVVNALNRASTVTASAPVAATASVNVNVKDGATAHSAFMPKLPLTGDRTLGAVSQHQEAPSGGTSAESARPDIVASAAGAEPLDSPVASDTADSAYPTPSGRLSSAEMESVLNEVAADVSAAWQDETNRKELPLRVS